MLSPQAPGHVQLQPRKTSGSLAGLSHSTLLCKGGESLCMHRPFLLQAKTSYTQIGIFSIALYPYSFKLLWSPLVDSLYTPAFGRRKSWVVRFQFHLRICLRSVK